MVEDMKRVRVKQRCSCARHEGPCKSGVTALLIITWVVSFKSRPLHHRVNSSWYPLNVGLYVSSDCLGVLESTGKWTSMILKWLDIC